MNVTDAKRDFLRIVRDVAAGAEPIAIVRNGKPVAQLCGIESIDTEFQSHHRQARSDSSKTAFGSLHEYADSKKRKHEKEAWRRAVEVKHGNCS